ncbi:MAG TPA: hypothetical protein VHP83_05260 [Aggregatilineaceae bacterium]|nr:hypothetical protein [Aggregatilineaceae bacterium]
MQRTVSAPTVQHSRARAWGKRLGLVIFWLFLAWLLIEVLLRIFFFSLPPRLQLVLQPVHVTPFGDRKLMPEPIWQPDRKYQTITRPVQNLEQYGTAEVGFRVNTTSFSWADKRVAFRLEPEQTNRYVAGVAVGDSFTFCFSEEAECWVQRLSESSGRNILNLGITSTGSVSHLRVLQDFGKPFKPRVVFWQWYGNDANEDYGLAQLDPSIQPEGNPAPESSNPPPAADQTNWLDENSAFYVVVKMLLGQDDHYEASLQFLDRETAEEGNLRLMFGRPYLWGAFDTSLPQNQYGWELTKRAILAAENDLSYDDGTEGELVVLLMPTKEQVYWELAEPLIGADKMAVLNANYDVMLNFCQQEKLTCIDLLPVFKPYAEQGEQLYYTTDIHLNPRGNDVLAAYLNQWLTEHPELFEGAPES